MSCLTNNGAGEHRDWEAKGLGNIGKHSKSYTVPKHAQNLMWLDLVHSDLSLPLVHRSEIGENIHIVKHSINVKKTQMMSSRTRKVHELPLFMPPPLGAGGIMFSGCPFVHPSVRPSVRPKPEIPSSDLYMGPLVHPTNRNHFTACPSVRPSVRPSGEVSGHFPDNALRDWPEILHADVSWPPSEQISLWPWSVDFSNFGTILT